jgi:hypothetical protein
LQHLQGESFGRKDGSAGVGEGDPQAREQHPGSILNAQRSSSARIFKANAAPVGTAWMWTLAFGHHEDRTPTHGYAESREVATEFVAHGCHKILSGL